MRVITYYEKDVDEVAKIVEQEFTVDKENSIDKRAALEPDRFGYCSVHYVIEMSPERLNLRENQPYAGLKCEIQIRSVLQHAWAEIEHDLGYKSEIAIPRGIRRNFSRLAGLLEIADKEFQEIRSFLWSYQNEAMENVKSDEFQDAEIDAILLRAIITTNPDIKALNEIIENCFHLPISEEISTTELERTINRLHWFDINTVNQLNNLIENNKDVAATVAKRFAQRGEKYKNVGEGPFLSTIALFYICYAELIRRDLSYTQIMQYFIESSISIGLGEENAVHFLLHLREEINGQS